MHPTVSAVEMNAYRIERQVSFTKQCFGIFDSTSAMVGNVLRSASRAAPSRPLKYFWDGRSPAEAAEAAFALAATTRADLEAEEEEEGDARRDAREWTTTRGRTAARDSPRRRADARRGASDASRARSSPAGARRNADIERARAATVGPRASEDPRASTGVTSPLIYRPRARRGARDSARGPITARRGTRIRKTGNARGLRSYLLCRLKPASRLTAPVAVHGVDRRVPKPPAAIARIIAASRSPRDRREALNVLYLPTPPASPRASPPPRSPPRPSPRPRRAAPPRTL